LPGLLLPGTSEGVKTLAPGAPGQPAPTPTAGPSKRSAAWQGAWKAIEAKKDVPDAAWSKMTEAEKDEFVVEAKRKGLL